MEGKGRALFFVGLFVVILPQLLINIHQSDAYTPLVISKADVLGKRESLYEWHLAYGMRVQKFEVLVPPVGQYSLMCITEDPDGKALLVKVNDNQSFKKVSSYAEAVFREPVRFTALFGRHLFNGLDIRFASPYLWGGLVKTDSELR